MISPFIYNVPVSYDQVTEEDFAIISDYVMQRMRNLGKSASGVYVCCKDRHLALDLAYQIKKDDTDKLIGCIEYLDDNLCFSKRSFDLYTDDRIIFYVI